MDPELIENIELVVHQECGGGHHQCQRQVHYLNRVITQIDRSIVCQSPIFTLHIERGGEEQTVGVLLSGCTPRNCGGT